MVFAQVAMLLLAMEVEVPVVSVPMDSVGGVGGQCVSEITDRGNAIRLSETNFGDLRSFVLWDPLKHLNMIIKKVNRIIPQCPQDQGDTDNRHAMNAKLIRLNSTFQKI